MRWLRPLLFFLISLHAADQPTGADQRVDAKGITPKVKLEEVISGHLAELNGKFKLRVTEMTLEPGAYLGEHHHAGPGIRFVSSRTVTFTQAGQATLYRAGDYFYESGNIVHTAHNKTKSPVRVVFVEILSAEWSGTSVIPPRAY